MSGHSHAKTIKHQKNLTDQKRGQMFSKMARVISVAVKEGGPNPQTNSKLQAATGGGSEENLEEVLFEAYGPGGVAIIVDGITDNTNRTLGEMKQILNQHGGKLAGSGSVKWM